MAKGRRPNKFVGKPAYWVLVAVSAVVAVGIVSGIAGYDRTTDSPTTQTPQTPLEYACELAADGVHQPEVAARVEIFLADRGVAPAARQTSARFAAENAFLGDC